MISGRIAEISGNLLIVSSQGQEYSVITSPATHIFTPYGGIVLFSEICANSRVDVWYADPDANFIIAYAASIRVPKSC